MATVPANVNYTFSEAQVEQLKAYGTIRAHDADALLTEEGQTHQDFLVTLSGETHIFVTTPDGPKRVGWMEPGQFTGDISVITGAASLVRVRSEEHTSELQSRETISYAVFCLKKKKKKNRKRKCHTHRYPIQWNKSEQVDSW